MKLNWRNWHAWLSILLSIPVFLVGVTAVLIAHHNALGLRDIPINGGWLQGNRDKWQAAPEIKASLAASDGRQYLGTLSGLYILENGRIRISEPQIGTEIRSLAENASLLVAAGNKGAWLLRDGVWRAIYRHPVHHAQVSAAGAIYLATADEGLLVSNDQGLSWHPDRLAIAALQQLPADAKQVGYSLDKLVMDVHTGKAFFGRRWEWLWIDSLGLLMVFLCLTGVYLWWKGQKRQTGLGAANR